MRCSFAPGPSLLLRQSGAQLPYAAGPPGEPDPRRHDNFLALEGTRRPASLSCRAMIRAILEGRPGLPPPPDLRATLLAAWKTNNRVTVHLIQRLPAALWDIAVPGVPQRTIRMIAAHLHNARCRWVKTLGREHGITAPARVDHRRVARRQLVAALKQSSNGIEALLKLGLASGGQIPPSRGYVWRNLSLDVGHVLTYFVAHEAHHRGQIIVVARQTGHRLPRATTDGLWQWKMAAAAVGR